LELCSRLTRESLQEFLVMLTHSEFRTAHHLHFLAAVVFAGGRTVKTNKSLVVRAVCESPEVTPRVRAWFLSVNSALPFCVDRRSC
jgi:hypothetical protein